MESFAVKVEEGKQGQAGQPSVGPVYRNLLAEHVYPPVDPNLSTCWDIFRESVEKHSGNRMLGWRELADGKWGPYVWKTYKEVYEETLQAGSALRKHGFEPGARVGVYGSNCPQWIVAMEACNAHSFICVPLYDTLGPGAVDYILDHAEVDVVFVQDTKVKELQFSLRNCTEFLTPKESLLQLLNPECTHARRLKLIICFTSLTGEQKDKAASIGITTYSWKEILNMGRETPCEISPPKPSDIGTIMYTSGTSGDPKGVILTHENISTNIRGVDLFMEQFEDKMTVDDVYISFLPLAHILDRMIEEYFFHKGASVGYYHGNINEIRDDLLELKPTFLAGVLKAVEELNWRRRKIFDMLYKYKLYWLNKGYKQKDASPLADLLAFGKIKSRLGGRLRLIVSGGAALSSEVEEFLRVTSCAFVVQGYGLTESCGLSTIGFPDEMCMIGTVGSPFVYSEVCLKEVEDMGYDPLGNPPRGEICLRAKTPFAGYYKNPELTQEVVKDGWFHTGDIGEMLPNGVVKIIDRKKNLIKLSQGEYVAVEYLEKVYTITPVIEDIWVYGDSFKSMLVSVVVPNEENTLKWAKQNGLKGSFLDLCSLDQLKDHIILELKSTAERNKLRGFEHIKGVIVEPQLFELSEKELVTATLKKRRDRLLKQYKVEIDSLYQKLTKARS
ncbi:long-chain-fatty-acid CoA ligase [Striga asiatica]|uniref:Long-chain-fatty-acid--CoA ligase n=1 Tax=Striga asiatica TaxID=4170 RepID=A0A5A7QC10_STRAF|nr:long-chain-fatty-acid CoA ligase [Striga asiatica]